MGGVDTDLSKQEKTKESRAHKETQQRLKEEERKQTVRCLENSEPDLVTSNSTSSDSDHIVRRENEIN